MAIVELLYELAPWDLINTLFIPFIVIFVILWGILTAMGFFNKKVNAVISFGLVLFLASTDLFPMLSQWMIQLGSMTAVVAFLLIFVGGVVIWSINRGRDIYYRTSPEKARLKVLKDMENVRNKMVGANDKDRRAYLKEFKKLKDKLEILDAET
jgi:uncharacterized membrane protein